MADTNRTDLRDKELRRAGRIVSPSWLDGLPHNFDGWGPKTPDDEAADVVIHAAPRPDLERRWRPPASMSGISSARRHH